MMAKLRGKQKFVCFLALLFLVVSLSFLFLVNAGSSETRNGNYNLVMPSQSTLQFKNNDNFLKFIVDNGSLVGSGNLQSDNNGGAAVFNSGTSGIIEIQYSNGVAVYVNNQFYQSGEMTLSPGSFTVTWTYLSNSPTPTAHPHPFDLGIYFTWIMYGFIVMAACLLAFAIGRAALKHGDTQK